MSQELEGRVVGLLRLGWLGRGGGLGSLGKARPRLAWHGRLDPDSLLLVCVGVHIVSACA